MGIGLVAVILLLAAAATAMFWPLWSGRRARTRREGQTALEIARDSKLAELGDLELDFRLGKLSTDDYQALNATLRSEAVEIIRRIDAASANGKPARSSKA